MQVSSGYVGKLRQQLEDLAAQIFYQANDRDRIKLVRGRGGAGWFEKVWWLAAGVGAGAAVAVAGSRPVMHTGIHMVQQLLLLQLLLLPLLLLAISHPSMCGSHPPTRPSSTYHAGAGRPGQDRLRLPSDHHQGGREGGQRSAAAQAETCDLLAVHPEKRV